MNQPLALRLGAVSLAVAAVTGAAYIENRRPYTLRPAPDIGLAQASEHTSWPWPNAEQSPPHKGVTHWLVTSRDGTLCELLEFDFAANPALRLELHAQDEDEAVLLDNNIQFWPMGVGQAVKHLNGKGAKTGAGTVVAAINGPFFGYLRVSKRVQAEIGFHLSPVVLRGQVFHNTGNHRWAFGVKYLGGRPVFKAFHLPGRQVLEREFDYASGTIQCLIKDGQALKLEGFPRGPRDFKPQPVPSTRGEAGHIPYFDHAKFSRVSMGWKSGGSKLYWLVVREPNGDSEGQSIEALARWQPQSRGWNVPDVQRFWLSMQKAGLIDNAINSDAGDCAQLAFLKPDGNYELVSPIGDNPAFERRDFRPDFAGAPEGGTACTL
jgi:hypothetical protein